MACLAACLFLLGNIIPAKAMRHPTEVWNVDSAGQPCGAEDGSPHAPVDGRHGHDCICCFSSFRDGLLAIEAPPRAPGGRISSATAGKFAYFDLAVFSGLLGWDQRLVVARAAARLSRPVIRRRPTRSASTPATAPSPRTVDERAPLPLG
jgi:hypothetical protein